MAQNLLLKYFNKLLKFTIMKKFIFIYVLALCFIGNSQTIKLDVLNITYTGDGILTYSATTDYKYDFQITGVISSSVNRLTIKPVNKSRNSVFINSISADGPIDSINVTFPPGKDKNSCVRNISVEGYVKNIKIIGGDLGASDGKDGKVVIDGYLKSLMVKGKKYNVPKTKKSEWWGGNIWADITVNGYAKKIMAKGGNICYAYGDSLLGSIIVNGDISKISVGGVIVKTNREDKLSKVMFGGAIGSIINCGENELKNLNVKGGTIKGSGIYCRQLGKVQVTGQKADVSQPQPLFPLTDKGISKVFIETAEESGDYKLASLKNSIVKNGSIKDTIYSVKGNLNAFKITGDTVAGLGNVENFKMRIGYQGELSDSKAPEITTETVVTNIGTNVTLIVKFEVKNMDPGRKVFTRIHYRDLAYNSFISNYNGEVYKDGMWWESDASVTTGMFVWTSTDDLKGAYLDVTLRARNDGIPYKQSDASFSIGVDFTNLPPVLVLIPSYNPIEFNIDTMSEIVWTCMVYDVNSDDSISLNVSGPQGFDSFVITEYKKRRFSVKAITNDLVAGSYTGVIFKATDGTGFEDSKTITVNVTTNVPVLLKGQNNRKSGIQIQADGTIPFPGNIGQINVIGNVYDSLFAAGTKDTTPNDWESSEYLGKISGVNIKGTAVSNTFVSQKKISIPKRSEFDFIKNIIWRDGVRVTNDYQ